MARSFYQSRITTPLGEMIAVADEQALYLLEFIGRRGLDQELATLQRNSQMALQLAENHIIQSIKQELSLYFAGKLTAFKTPLYLSGTSFQQQVWRQLQKIPTGQTRSYRQLAEAVGNAKGYRAVANANGANQIAIVIPCHRVINANGGLGGYAAGLERKQWLLTHEAKCSG